MLIYAIPGAPCSRLGTLLSALIIVFCAVGLTLHEDFYAGIRRRGFFCYFTNLSNLLVLVYFSLLAPLLYTCEPLQWLIPHAEFAVAANIMLTCAVFSSLLLPQILPRIKSEPMSRTMKITISNSAVVHHIVPLLTAMYWLFCSPWKQRLTPADAFLWMIVPAVYLAAVLRRGAKGIPLFDTGLSYPYPFLDVKALGARHVLSCCIRLGAASAAASMAAVAAARMIPFP